MRHYRPPFLTEADEVPIGSVAKGFDLNDRYTGSLFGKDRIGHTTPNAEVSTELLAYTPTLSGSLAGGSFVGTAINDRIRSNEFALPRHKVAATNATMSKAGEARLSNKYIASNVR